MRTVIVIQSPSGTLAPWPNGYAMDTAATSLSCDHGTPTGSSRSSSAGVAAPGEGGGRPIEPAEIAGHMPETASRRGRLGRKDNSAAALSLMTWSMAVRIRKTLKYSVAPVCPRRSSQRSGSPSTGGGRSATASAGYALQVPEDGDHLVAGPLPVGYSRGRVQGESTVTPAMRTPSTRAGGTLDVGSCGQWRTSSPRCRTGSPCLPATRARGELRRGMPGLTDRRVRMAKFILLRANRPLK